MSLEVVLDSLIGENSPRRRLLFGWQEGERFTAAIPATTRSSWSAITIL